jgi:tetratricopeptide (TPR) repeat protein
VALLARLSSAEGPSVIDLPEWQSLKATAIWRRHAGDIDGAICDLLKAIELTRPIPKLARETATGLNYLADMYLMVGAEEQAEKALRESIELSRPRFPLLLAANLWIRGGMQSRQGRRDDAAASAQESRRLCQQHGHPYGVRQAEELLERIQANSV